MEENSAGRKVSSLQCAWVLSLAEVATAHHSITPHTHRDSYTAAQIHSPPSHTHTLTQAKSNLCFHNPMFLTHTYTNLIAHCIGNKTVSKVTNQMLRITGSQKFFTHICFCLILKIPLICCDWIDVSSPSAYQTFLHVTEYDIDLQVR